LPWRQRVALLIGLLIAGIAGLGLIDPFAQDPAYHLFADTRAFFGIPNFNDVASNAGFALVGILGLLTVTGLKGQVIFLERIHARPYIVFFAAVALVSLGSAYYHWAPSNERLFLDRLPMAVAFMAFCAAVIADRIHARAGNTWLLALLIALGVFSLVYWYATEQQGRGDLRFYALIQFYPMVAIPLVCVLFPRHRHTAGRCVVLVIAWYAVAKIVEHFDREIFSISGQIVSGHTLKHLAATVATYIILRMLLAPRSGTSR
jgi:hypothetical protein